MSENSPGVRAASCSTLAVICASGNDLCHSASNWDLTLQLTHMLFIAASVIPLHSCCVCARQHRPDGKKERVDTWWCVELKFSTCELKPTRVQLTWHLFRGERYLDRPFIG